MGAIVTEQDGAVITTPAEELKGGAIDAPKEPEAGKVDGQKDAKTPEEGKDDKGEDKTPPWLKKRIDEVTAKRHAAEREAAKAREEAAYYKGLAEGSKKMDAPPPAGIDVEPRLENFETVDLYTKAMVDYGITKAKADFEKSFAMRAEAEMKKKAEAESAQSFESQVKKAQERYPDFNETVLRQPEDGGPQVSVIMANVLQSSDMGADVAYFLGKNPHEAARISQIGNPLLVAREIGRIEAKLSLAPKPEVAIPSAPPPIEPLAGKTGDATVDPEKMSDDEWFAWNKAQVAARLKKRT